MKINGIDRTRLRNHEHFQFHTEFRDLVLAEGVGNLGVETLFAGYLALYGREDEGINRITKSALTEKLREADRARDETWSGMAEIVGGSRKHHSEAVREAARKLKILFDTYGNVSRKPMDEQTAAVYNALRELRGDYLEAAKTLRLDEWADELERRNDAFEALVKARDGEAAGRSGVVMTAARRELDASYETIIGHISARALLDGAARYEPFARTLNAVVARYVAALRNRAEGRRPQGRRP